jgi:hypothetical protein
MRPVLCSSSTSYWKVLQSSSVRQSTPPLPPLPLEQPLLLGVPVLAPDATRLLVEEDLSAQESSPWCKGREDGKRREGRNEEKGKPGRL